MKPIIYLLLVVFGMNALAQKAVLQHNVFFQSGQTGLMETQKAIVSSIFEKIQTGQRIMIFPLTNDSLMESILFSEYADVQADEILNFATSLGYEGKVQHNFPCGYKGRSVAVSLSKSTKSEAIPTQPFVGHYPEKPSQFFLVDTDRDTVIYGNEGTAMYIPAGGFLTAAAKVQVELKEFYSFADLMKQGMHTASNGRMLQTGGSIYLNAKEENEHGKQTKINPEKGIKTDFTLGKNDPEMQVFIKDPNKQELNWILGRNIVRTVTERVVWTDGKGNVISEQEAMAQMERFKKRQAERKAAEEQYEIDRKEAMKREAEFEKQRKYKEQFDKKLTVYDLGFINCDKFPDEPMRQMQAKADDRYTATYYLVYKDVRGVVQGWQQGQDVNFGGVPKNRTATLMAVAFDGPQAYFSSVELSPSTAAKPEIKLQPVSEKFVDQQLALLK